MEFKFGYLESKDVLADGSLRPELLGAMKTVVMVKSDSCSHCAHDFPIFRAMAKKVNQTNLYAANVDVGVMMTKKYLNMNLSFVPMYIGIQRQPLHFKRLETLQDVERFVAHS